MTSLRTLVLLGIGTIAGGLLTFWAPWRAAPTPAEATVDAAAVQYQCPMHPHVVADQSGPCPICGMQMVVRKAAPDTTIVASPEPSAVHIDPAQQHLIGLRLADVEMGAVGASWHTIGRVAAEEPRVRQVTVKVEGYVEQLNADFIGKAVTRGQPLLSLYSPEMFSAQKDYLIARSAGSQALLSAARKRLLLWDIAPSTLDALEKAGEPTKTLPLLSPISGVVTAKSVVEGAHVNAGDTLFEITDLSEVWVLADVYERELGRVQRGMAATLVLQAFENKQFYGVVSFIDPVLNAATRTARVRLTFPNPRGELRPALFGEVSFAGNEKQGLRIPADAIIRTGARSVVFVAQGDGKFVPRQVQTGRGVGDFVEILSGLQAGEHVVVQASFLVDSEARLKGVLHGETRRGAP